MRDANVGNGGGYSGGSAPITSRAAVPTVPTPPAPAPAPSPKPTPAAQPAAFTPPTSDLDILNCVADAMQQPPPQVTQDYTNRCKFAASFLQVPPAAPAQVTQPPVATGAGWFSTIIKTVNAAVSKITWQPPTGQANPGMTNLWSENEYGRGVAAQSSANVLAFIERVNQFIQQANANGFAPPDNPFAVLAQWNSDRHGQFSPITVAADLASALVYNMKAYVDLLQAYNQGGVDFNSSTGFNSAQLAHVKLSFDGLGGSGNPAVDILNFLPTRDQVKQEAARQALSVLDFTKRIPYLLFTADYAPVQGQPPQGTLLGWKKIPDASGYIITRREVFSTIERTFEVTNVALDQTAASLMDYAQRTVLNFFDNITPSTVSLFLDTDIQPDALYIYKIQAYQIKNNKKGSTFAVDTVPVSLTLAGKQNIGQLIRQMSNWPDYTVTGYNTDGTEIRDYNDFQETISPWPAFAQYIYGDSSYDWLLAAANIRASITRGDNKATTRRYSYLNAHSDFIEGQADIGQFVKPASVDQVVNNIQESIQNFGVNQTIQMLLDETGISYYFEGRDPNSDPYFDRAGTVNTSASPLFNMIGSSIDPETATLDLKHLSTNMQLLLGQNTLSVSAQVLPGAAGAPNGKPTEISIPDPSITTDTTAATGLQFIDKLGDLSQGTLDLTTYDGLSKLMRVIRILSDFGPNRLPSVNPPKNAPAPPPISISPSSAQLNAGDAIKFTASGGSGTGYKWSLPTATTHQFGVSGGTIDQTGRYQAGQAGGRDIVRVTDPAGRYIEATVDIAPPPPPPPPNTDPGDATQTPTSYDQGTPG